MNAELRTMRGQVDELLRQRQRRPVRSFDAAAPPALQAYVMASGPVGSTFNLFADGSSSAWGGPWKAPTGYFAAGDSLDCPFAGDTTHSILETICLGNVSGFLQTGDFVLTAPGPSPGVRVAVATPARQLWTGSAETAIAAGATGPITVGAGFGGGSYATGLNACGCALLPGDSISGAYLPGLSGEFVIWFGPCCCVARGKPGQAPCGGLCAGCLLIPIIDQTTPTGYRWTMPNPYCTGPCTNCLWLPSGGNFLCTAGINALFGYPTETDYANNLKILVPCDYVPTWAASYCC